MIRILDVWDASPPPSDGGDDDTLLACAATPHLPTIIIGDRDGPTRARSVGIACVAHVAVRHRQPWLAHRKLARLLIDLDRPVCRTVSGFSQTFANLAGAIPIADEPDGAPVPALPEHDNRLASPDLVVPIASHTSRIPAGRLVETSGILGAGGKPITMLLPIQAEGSAEARSRASRADRVVPMLPTRLPPACWLRHAGCILDFGAAQDGPQIAFARHHGIPIVEASGRHSALSLAIGITQALASRTTSG